MASRISRATIASTVGTALEWYDFSLYGTAAALVFSTVFFPGGDQFAATLASLATFAVGFFARPVGGVVIGIFGDRIGRRTMLFVTLSLMAASSTLVGCLPGYASIGTTAPVLLVVLRVLQGIGAGGEYAGAMLLSAEHAKSRARGLNASAPTLGNAVGALIATGVFSLCSVVFTHEQFLAFGWRIPFLLSCLVGIGGILIRLKIDDSPELRQARKNERAPVRAPLRELLRHSRRSVAAGMLVSVAPNVISYLPSVYALTYLADNVGAAAWIGLTGIIIANVIKLVTVPTAGWLCDRFGRRPVMFSGSVAAAAMFYPFFVMLDTGTPVVVWAAFVLVYTFCNDLTLASQATILSELFDVRHRYTGVTFSRETVGALVGGGMPLVAAQLSRWAGGSWSVVVCCAALCLLSTIGALMVNEPTYLRIARAGTAPGIRADRGSA